jgi:hypothetical protein
MGPEGFSKIGAGKDTLPALPVIFQIGAGMVGPEWYRAGTSETLYTTVPYGLSLHDTLIIDFSELYIQKLSI